MVFDSMTNISNRSLLFFPTRLSICVNSSIRGTVLLKKNVQGVRHQASDHQRANESPRPHQTHPRQVLQHRGRLRHGQSPLPPVQHAREQAALENKRQEVEQPRLCGAHDARRHRALLAAHQEPQPLARVHQEERVEWAPVVQHAVLLAGAHGRRVHADRDQCGGGREHGQCVLAVWQV